MPVPSSASTSPDTTSPDTERLRSIAMPSFGRPRIEAMHGETIAIAKALIDAPDPDRVFGSRPPAG